MKTEANLGFTGRILRVDLSTGTLAVDDIPKSFCRQYIGGRSMIASWLLRETRAGVDPLGPSNLLIFAPGVITGAPVSGSGRHAVGAKSPLTGGIASSEAGGFWGTELKRAGFDAVMISGQAPEPVYLWIHDGSAQLRDATDLWGLKTGDADEVLRDSLRDDRIRTSVIGPAGEQLVRYANVVFGLSHFAGRGGLGAVMGSKRLKAIAVRASRGRGRIRLAQPKVLQRIARWVSANLELVADLHDAGTASGVVPLNEMGGLPTRNFQGGQFSGAEAISGERMRDTILVGRGTCYACAVRCKRMVESHKPYPVPRAYGGPEYETLAAFGSNCGIDDLQALAYANSLCAAYGLDTISAGGAIAFAMECFEEGLITPADTGGVELRFGDPEAMLWALQSILHRDGLGDLLAEGVRRAADSIGGRAGDFALHVKGQELPLHEPRLKHGLGLGYAVSPTGADHEHNMHDTGFAVETRDLHLVREFGDFSPLPPDDLSEAKVRMFVHYVNWRHLNDCLLLCNFIPYDVSQVVEIVRAVTGWEVDKWELLRAGERAATLARLYNVREGLGAQDDALPHRFYDSFADGSLAGVAIDRTALENAKLAYYREMGWGPDGRPMSSRLAELGLEDLA